MTIQNSKPNTSEEKKSKRLSEAEKAKAKAMWEAGTATLEELSVKFGVDKSNLFRLFKKDGVEKNKNVEAVANAAKAAVEQQIINDALVHAQRVKETKDEHYRMSNAIGKILFAKIINNEKAGIKHGTIAGDIKALKLTMETLEIIQRQKYITLGINPDEVGDESPLPDLVVQELSVEDIEKIRQENIVEDDYGLDMEKDMGDEDLLRKEELDDKVITE